MKEAYRDYSIFSGIRQYYDEGGKVWRRQDVNDYCFFFKEVDEIFILDGLINGEDEIESIKDLHERYLREGWL